jgi:hypothetical protein
MWTKYLFVCAAALLAAGCSFLTSDDWKVADRGYNLNVAPYGNEFSMEVHVNELKQHGGDVKTAEFRLFVSERLKRHELCERGWELLPCVEDGSCVSRTHHSVTVFGRCLLP